MDLHLHRVHFLVVFSNYISLWTLGFHIVMLRIEMQYEVLKQLWSCSFGLPVWCLRLSLDPVVVVTAVRLVKTRNSATADKQRDALCKCNGVVQTS